MSLVNTLNRFINHLPFHTQKVASTSLASGTVRKYYRLKVLNTYGFRLN